ncbi:MAG TPA: RNA-guided pseudouridylation complex pseudouridine synthase subunit Cbf5 [archaeon]|nr:RNA-guided pseudouridylation complex pseudouridine synthase subunit Cbf5 [archaeon]
MEKLFRSIILLDKSAGPTSLECAEIVRRIFSAKKAGHAGTLDPGVTGVLIIALDEATKLMPVLMGLEKEYEGVMHVHRDFMESELRDAAKSFIGKVIQTPPVKSAVSRKPREREVHSFEILRISGRDVSFRVSCQAGTYIRKLCSDLGERMGTQTHMKSLRRIRAGPFSLKDCVTLERLEKSPEKYPVPLEKAFRKVGVKKIHVKEKSVQKILNGSPVHKDFVRKTDSGIRKGEYVGIFFGRKLMALGVAAEGRTVAKTERVFRD